MTAADSGDHASVRLQPDDRPPVPLALGLGLQFAVLIIARIVVIPMVVVRAAGGSDAYLSWALFAAVSICGLTTVLQALRIGRFGSGYVAVMGTSLAVVGVGVTAIAEGGPALFATLVAVASLVPFALSARLALFRRILTPTVSGTVILLIPATLMPSAFGLLTDVPPGTPVAAGAACAVATLAVILAITMTGTAALRLWSPVIGVAAGAAVAALFGLYDAGRIADAPWIGIPASAWPGLDLSFGPLFWALLPAFLLVALIESVQTISNAVATQRVSWRRRRAADYRAVQGAVAAAGAGNLLSGLAGTVPNTLLSTSVAVTDLTGAAARRVGIAAGAVFVLMAVAPKMLAVVLAIPGPVVAAYLAVLMATLFLLGMQMVLQGGIDQRKTLIVGVSFWVGAGFQYGIVFPEFAEDFAGGMLRSGVTSGGLAAILMTALMEATRPRRSRIETVLDPCALPRVTEFLAGFAARAGVGRAHGAAPPCGRRGNDADADRASGQRCGRRRSPAPADGTQGRRRRGPRVRRGRRPGQPGGPHGVARRTGRRGHRRAGSLVAAPAPPGFLRPSRAVPRHRHRDGPRGPAGRARRTRLRRLRPYNPPMVHFPPPCACPDPR